MTASRSKLTIYSEVEIPTKLEDFGLDHWRLEEGWICRTFTTDNWLTTLALVNAIGFVAEAAGHHPDLAVSFRAVSVSLRTHSVNGVTDRDFALARRIEDIALWKPLPEGPFGPNPNDWIKG